MSKLNKAQKQSVYHVYKTAALVWGVILLLLAGLAGWASVFAGDMVRQELAAQKIYFPPKGSEGLKPDEYPDLQKYAGQLVDTPQEAKAYANGFIGRHLKDVADGKVYAEVSEEARKNPTDQKLQGQRQALFMGETLRGILLGTGYAFGLVGQIAGIASVTFLAAGVLLLCAAAWFKARI